MWRAIYIYIADLNLFCFTYWLRLIGVILILDYFSYFAYFWSYRPPRNLA